MSETTAFAPKWRRRTSRMLVVSMTTMALAATACTSGQPTSGGRSGSPEERHDSKARAGPDEPARWPLTGLPAGKSLPDRPALAIKIDNAPAAEPQIGLAKADLIVEEPIEGGLTRLAAFYHSKLPPVAGPVRSIRTSDAGLLTATDAILVASGGAPKAKATMRRADVRTTFPGNKPGFFRVDRREVPHNLMVHPRRVARAQPETKPEPLLPRAEESAERATAKKVESVAVSFSSSHTTRWKFGKSKGWRRTGGLAADGQEFAPETLLILRVRTRPAGYRDPAGAPVPEVVLKGSGKAWLLDGRHLIKARWSKKKPSAAFRLTTRDGERLELPPGHTWIELMPRSGGMRSR